MRTWSDTGTSSPGEATDRSNASGDAPAPLRILIGCDTFAPDVNGAAKFAERLGAGMVALGHEVHVMAPSPTGRRYTSIEVHEGKEITVHRLYSWRWFPHDWLRFALPWRIKSNSARVLDEVKPDVVHFQSHIIVGRGLSEEATNRGIRIIGTNHFMPENMLEFTLLPKWFQQRAIQMAWRAARRTFSRAAAVTTPTRRAAEFLEKYTGLSGVHSISCGIDSSKYTPSFEPRTENRVLFVGRVTGEKNIDLLLTAMTLLPTSLDTKLEIVGGGDQLKNLQNLAVTLGIANRVTFTGYVSDEELKAAYTRATVFAMPSTAELQSIATMEAMASGLPIVAANAMALPHLVHDGNGYLFEPGDPHDMADKLAAVLTAPEDELGQMKRKSLKHIKAHDIDCTLATFQSLYRGESVTAPVTGAIPIIAAE